MYHKKELAACMFDLLMVCANNVNLSTIELAVPGQCSTVVLVIVVRGLKVPQKHLVWKIK